MLARVFSGTTIGLDGVLIEVEVDVASSGFPTFTIVGLPNKAIDEAKDRVRSAITNAFLEMPDSRLTINLAPADIPKEGSAFDLPIAVGILAASGLIKKDWLENSLFLGELSLQGKLRRVCGAISIVSLAKKKRLKNIFLPRDNILEAGLIEDINIYAVDSLADLILHLNGQKIMEKQPVVNFDNLCHQEKNFEFDFSDISGQHQAKRALEIAAAGFHNLHLQGPPGAGKTMLSRAFPGILPAMTKEEVLDVSKIYSIVGLLSNSFFIVNRPFRSPHHTTSRIGLIGGGSNPGPGEVTLAHRGVLFLDELPEFPRHVLEALRQPLEDGIVTISRARGSLTFPCRFLLLSACNPCPCGFLGHPKKPCRCLPGTILRYKKRLSGPLLDRIDLHVDVPPVEEEKLVKNNAAETTEKIRQRVALARQRQHTRFVNLTTKTNGEMGTAQVRKYCQLTEDAVTLLKTAISKLGLSARSYFKVIKIGQTITDLEGKDKIEAAFIAEALQYRIKDNY